MIKFFGVRGGAAIPACLLATAALWWTLAGVANAVTVAQPTIPPGTPREGQVLTLTNGAATPTTAAITDQWERCTGAVCTAIPGQTAATYTVSAGDVGHTIRVLETATDAPSPPSPVSVASAQTATVLPLPPANAALPAISGTAQQGQVLTLTQGAWTNSPTVVTDQWEVCTGATCTPIIGQTGATYTVAPTDVGHTIDVLETAGNAGGPAALAAKAAPTAAVVPPPPANIAPPTISGTAQQGQALTVTQGAWTNSPVAVADQWEQCDVLGGGCTPIPGQTGPTYAPGPGDVGHTIEVVETAMNAGGSGLAAVSLGSAVVTATSFTSVVTVSANSPTTNQTVTLVATVTSSSGNADLSGSMSFFNGSTGVPGCGGKAVKGHQTVTVTCQASFSAGSAAISATYQPGAGSLVQGSTSSPTDFGIGRDSTSISLAVTKQVAVGKRATYVATLVPPAGNSGPIGPTGSIEFLDHGQPIGPCLSRPLSNLAATCTVQYRSLGKHDISALYSGDGNFTASASPDGSVQIVRSSTVPTVLGFVTSTLQWTFFYHPTYTLVALFKAFRIVKGTSVLATCQGEGCPFSKLRLEGSSAGSINLLPRFRHHHLRAGTRITVRLTHRHWIGKYYSFTIRASQPPLTDLTCLAVGHAVPGVSC
jgi:hypothetical protein